METLTPPAEQDLLNHPDLALLDMELNEFEAAWQPDEEEPAETQPPSAETAPIPTLERYLTEVDHLNFHRLPNGRHSKWTLEGVLENLVPAVKEAAMPFAVSETYQRYERRQDEDGRIRGVYTWLGKTAVEVAETGYKYHRHPAARTRVGVEIEEARETEETLRKGYVKLFLSPKMSGADAPHAVAKSEHLADDDALRIGWMDVDAAGNIQGKYLQSLLVRDIPLSAWVDMLRDPGNLFGKSITVEDEQSALAVMKVHSQLELPADKLPEGVITVVEAVIPYITDRAARKKVEEQLALFRTGQEELHEKAHDIARRWQQFEVALADSLADGYATPDVKQFLDQLKDEWNDNFLNMLDKRTLTDGRIRMDRRLAAKIEEARQNTLWTTAAVLTNNQDVLKQMPAEVARQIRDNEELIQTMRHEGYDTAQIEADNNRLIAQQNIIVGRGCPGEVEAAFRKAMDAENNANRSEENDSEKKWMSCPFCKAKVFDDPCAKKLSCWDCKARVVNGKVVDTGDGGFKKRSAVVFQNWGAEVADMGERIDTMFDEGEAEAIEHEEQQAQKAGQLAVAAAV